MPSPYVNTGVYDQRDAITKALMNVAAPPPQSQMPQMPQGRPQMGMPQMPPAGAPSMGTPPPGPMPMSMPLSPGIPPAQPTGVGTQTPMASQLPPQAGGVPGGMQPPGLARGLLR